MKIGKLHIGFDFLKAKRPQIDVPSTSDTITNTFSEPESSRCKILLICGGDTCRSPMAKIILQQKLRELGRLKEYDIQSAAASAIHSSQKASDGSREAMVALFGTDLLADHKSREVTPEMIGTADLILVMSPVMKDGLPPEKTFTLKEYAGDSGTIEEPFGSDFRSYLKTADEISYFLDLAMLSLLSLTSRTSQ
jgi:protein-tyrosine-phosphatase